MRGNQERPVHTNATFTKHFKVLVFPLCFLVLDPPLALVRLPPGRDKQPEMKSLGLPGGCTAPRGPAAPVGDMGVWRALEAQRPVTGKETAESRTFLCGWSWWPRTAGTVDSARTSWTRAQGAADTTEDPEKIQRAEWRVAGKVSSCEGLGTCVCLCSHVCSMHAHIQMHVCI